jgi:carbamoyltransferase
MAGGVALNSKANMELYYSRLFSDVFIFPAATDAGAAIGAAAWVSEHLLGTKMVNQRMKNAYYGPEYKDEEVKRLVRDSKWRAEYLGDNVSSLAGLVAAGKIVTWYQGRSELCPRALGNRSIIADSRKKEMWTEINTLKGREWWRPLAPSLLESRVKNYFVEGSPHEFMIMMYKFVNELKSRVPAVCHVDGTARPQTVDMNQNRPWYEQIQSFEEMTGEGIVVNTSFNLAGEPLVETPHDALRSFAVGGFDAMYLQGWLIRKS